MEETGVGGGVGETEGAAGFADFPGSEKHGFAEGGFGRVAAEPVVDEGGEGGVAGPHGVDDGAGLHGGEVLAAAGVALPEGGAVGSLGDDDDACGGTGGEGGDEVLRRAGETFVAHEEDVGGAEEIGVVGVVGVGENVEVGGDGYAGGTGALEEGAGEVDVAKDGQVGLGGGGKGGIGCVGGRGTLWASLRSQ